MDKFVLSSLVGGTLARLDSLITDEPIISSNLILRDELGRLQNLLMHCLDMVLITDVHKKRIGIPNVSYLINKLNEVVYKADEAIDELTYEILRFRPKVTLFNIVQKLIFNLNFARKVRILNDQLLDMTTNPEKMKHDSRITPSSGTYSVLDNYPVMGREADASKIVSLLTRSSDQQQLLTVVPIVGVDGLGKTSLAKLVCRRVMALDLFDVKMWVCVSEKCNEQKILGQILKSLNATIGGLASKNAVLQRLEKELRGKSFILVLDDVCGDVCRWWGDFKTWLLKICSNKSNAVLVITRSEEVASAVETSSQHRHTLHHLSSDLDRVTDIPLMGREADASKIVSLMTLSSDQQQLLTVVPIVGVDGLGKTSLAKLVLRRVMALKLFQIKKWICVSEKCDGQNILGQTVQCLNASMGGLTNVDGSLSERKRFLLVLDDVFEDVSRWWDDFRTRLLEICTHIETVVLVTTRSEKVASIIETSSQHRHTLNFLSDDECWFVLKERAAFRIVDAQVQSNLEDIGREIAKKCRGLPLAATVLGGTLRFKRDEESWLRIRDIHFSESRDIEESVKSILKLSFDHLPSSLKQCFGLCSIFPKGFSIIKEDLIQLWIAERFADPCDMGNTCFHALLAKSFFQDAEFDDEGNVIKCKMHNLVHDLVLSLEKSETRVHCLNADYQSIGTSEALPKNKAKHPSTIILNEDPFPRSLNSKRLRTLYLNDVDIENFPSTVSKSKSFRYLHVSNTKTRPLPKSITEISMLQILTLSNCSCEQLPLLGHLPCLKFLKISHMERVKCIGHESYEGNSSRHELRLFPALKCLCLSWMENLTAWTPPSHANSVVMFPLLEYLSIQSCAKLIGFPLRDLSALVKLELKDCVELRFMFDENKSFPSVTSLSIVGCPKLIYLRNWLLSNESYKEFRIRRCEWLKFIPKDLGMQRSLVSLHICCCKGLGFFSEEILCKLTQLRRLIIGAFSEKLDDFRYLNRIKDITCLEELEIWGSDVFGRKMSALPNQLQHLPKLKSLKIKGFTTMETLPEWFPDLEYLETISLNYCWHLNYQSTAATIQRLPYLCQVFVSGCRALEEHKFQWIEFSSKTKTRICFQ